MINITEPKNCCGCTACYSVCAQKAIKMEPDCLGFLYPKVDLTKCSNCGLCEKVCAFNDHYDISLNFMKPYAYAVRHRNIHEIETSRSGAAFIALRDWVLAQGGVVYGVGYKDHFRVCHKRATTKSGCDEFKGSKYVQSDMGDCFAEVKNDLKNGYLVLFSGTPCQTSGLSSFLGSKLRENLYLVDIVCHGVPGPFVWRDYLSYLEKKEHQQIVNVDFRDKKLFGWSDHKESFVFANSLKKYTYTYTYTFYQHIMFRHSCGVCHFTNLHRPSDITIADFWGWEKIDESFNADNKGCSLVFVNTDKGKKWFSNVIKDLNVKTVNLEDTLQPNLQHPSIISKERLDFEQYYSKHGFEKTMIKFSLMGWKLETKKKYQRLKSKIKRIFHL